MARVALIGENSKEYVAALIDIWNNGDCAVLLDWRIPFPALLSMIDEANVYRCIVEESCFEKFGNVHSDSIKLDTYKSTERTAEKIPDYIYDKYTPSYSKDEAIIIYSSGTTGNAKGIILSHFAINTNADAIIEYMCPRRDDCLYIVKPFSHSSSIKSVQPRNINDPANACSNACKNLTQDIAKSNYEANHKAYRSEHSQGC